jgi:hypothetical protein
MLNSLIITFWWPFKRTNFMILFAIFIIRCFTYLFVFSIFLWIIVLVTMMRMGTITMLLGMLLLLDLMRAGNISIVIWYHVVFTFLFRR